MVRLIDATWLHDVSEVALDEYEAYFGFAHPAFRTFLSSLGLRTHAGTGTDKPAYLALLAEAHARGWDDGGGSGGGGPGSGGGGGAGDGSGGSSGGCGAGQGFGGLAAVSFLLFTGALRRRRRERC